MAGSASNPDGAGRQYEVITPTELFLDPREDGYYVMPAIPPAVSVSEQRRVELHGYLNRGAGSFRGVRLNRADIEWLLSTLPSVSHSPYVLDLTGAVLVGENLSGLSFSIAIDIYTSLEEADLSEADLRAANLTSVKLNRAKLDRACLDGASIMEAGLDGASLRQASLVRAVLLSACLTNADLRAAHLEAAQLGRADLRHAHLQSAHLERIS